MKRQILLFSVLLLAAPAAAAPEKALPPPAAKSPAANKVTGPEKPPPSPPALVVSPAGSIESRQKQLTEQAGLDEAQQRKLHAILEKHDPAIKQAMAAWRASRSHEDRRKTSALVQSLNTEIAALLTDEQKAKAVTAQQTLPTRKIPLGAGPAGGSPSSPSVAQNPKLAMPRGGPTASFPVSPGSPPLPASRPVIPPPAIPAPAR